jgi:hypothetical protein
MPQSPTGDALHLALASVHGCDFLLTWNCVHLANPNKLDHIRHVNERLKRLKELNERVRGSMPNFMTQEDLRKMREDEKWETIHQTQGR